MGLYGCVNDNTQDLMEMMQHDHTLVQSAFDAEYHHYRKNMPLSISMVKPESSLRLRYAEGNFNRVRNNVNKPSYQAPIDIAEDPAYSAI